MSAIAGGAAIGAGVGVSSVALMPFNAANTFLGSSFFGYGMIFGERYMYQSDWPKVQQRLENGEKIENIIQEYTGRFTAVVMSEAKIIFDSVTREMIDIMKSALLGTTGTGTPGNTTLDVTVEKPPGPQPAPKPIIDSGEHTHYKQGVGVISHVQDELLKSQQITNEKIDQIIKNAPTAKPKATSVEIERRNALIQGISIAGARLKQIQSWYLTNNNQATRDQLASAQSVLNKLQIALSELLLKYIF